MSRAERDTLVEFVRYLEHREHRRDELLLAALGVR